MERLLLISNADAGSNADDVVDDVLRVLQSHFEVEVAATEGVDELESVLSRRADRDVAVVGGDGSLHAVVNVLHRNNELVGLTVGIIPLGTGNDFARGLGIPLEPAAAAEVITAGRRCLVDLLVDSEDTVVVNAVHAGIGADAGRAAVPLKWLGKLGYVLGALVAGLTTPGTAMRVIADDVVLADGSRRVLQVGIGNGSCIGGGVHLTPDADPSDGLADVIVSFSVGALTRFWYAVHLRHGTQEERHDVQVFRATRVTLSGRKLFCNADGELSDSFTERTWTIRPAALSIYAPAAFRSAHDSALRHND